MPAFREVVIKIFTFILLMMSMMAIAQETKNEAVFVTNLGEIVIQLDNDAAPNTVKNFKSYIEAGFYDGTIFHRTIPGFMIQGGGFAEDLIRKETQAPIENEADNGLLNEVGTIAMARTGDPHSATSQFFINVNNNIPLNFTSETPRGWGYAVFGKVTEGLEIVISISQLATKPEKGHANVPVETVTIEKAFLR